MAGRGLVAAGPPGPRDRKPYEVTPAGRAAFAEWLASGPGEDQVRIPLLLTIAFAGHLPAGPAGGDHRGPARRARRAARAVPRRPRMADARPTGSTRRGWRRWSSASATSRPCSTGSTCSPGSSRTPLTSHCGRSSVGRIRGLGDPVLNTILITVHAVAATIAFGAGALSAPAGRFLGIYRGAMAVMAAALVPAVLVDWSTTDPTARIVFVGLIGLAGVMVVRAELAVRRPSRPHRRADRRVPGPHRLHADLARRRLRGGRRHPGRGARLGRRGHRRRASWSSAT